MIWPFPHVIALVHQDFLVDARRGVGPHEFADGIDPDALFRVVFDFLFRLRQLAVFGDDDMIAADGGDLAAFVRDCHGARIAGHAVFQTGGHERRLGHEQRHGLPLHVGTHQRAVGVVVLQKRNQRRSDGHQLFRRNVHVIHACRLHVHEIRPGTANHPVGQEMTLVVNRRVGLRDDVLFLAVGGQVIQFCRSPGRSRPCDRAFRENRIR